MNELLDLIFVDGNLLETFCRVLILGLSMDMILGFASLIGESKKSL